MLQQQFIDEVLNTGLLLYASRTWLSQVFHQVIAQDLFASISAANTQVLTRLMSGNSILIVCGIFSRLFKWVGRQEGHPAFKRTGCWCIDGGDLTAALYISESG